MLSRIPVVEQVAVPDGEFFDFFPPFDDDPVAPDVDVGGGEVAETFMVSVVVVVPDLPWESSSGLK
jgi:hypothetical protein